MISSLLLNIAEGAAQAGIKEIAQRVAQQVQGHDRDHNRSARAHTDSRVGADEIAPVRDNRPPSWRWRLHAEAEKAEARLRRDGDGGVDARHDD